MGTATAKDLLRSLTLPARRCGCEIRIVQTIANSTGEPVASATGANSFAEIRRWHRIRHHPANSNPKVRATAAFITIPPRTFTPAARAAFSEQAFSIPLFANCKT